MPQRPSHFSDASDAISHRGLNSEELAQLRENFGDVLRVARLVVPSFLLFGAIIFVATLGYIALGWPPFDALYMVVISVFSVGYGEIQPVDKPSERIWTMLVIASGWAGVVMTLGNITRVVTEGELRRTSQTLRARRVMEHLRNHVIICGFGRMGQTLARELHGAKIAFVVIDRDEERIAAVRSEGFLAFRGDATEESTLQACGITHAKTLCTVLPHDALNVFITLTARNLSGEIKIISRGEQLSTERKLRQAGADEVILPAQIGAHRIANSIIEPEISTLLREASQGLDLHALGVEIDELRLHEHAHLVGKTVGEIGKMCGGDVLILGVRRHHEIRRGDLEQIVLEEGDALLAISRTQNLPAVLGRDVERTEIV